MTLGQNLNLPFDSVTFQAKLHKFTKWKKKDQIFLKLSQLWNSVWDKISLYPPSHMGKNFGVIPNPLFLTYLLKEYKNKNKTKLIFHHAWQC